MNAVEVKDILIKKLKFTHQDIEKLNIFTDELLKYNKKYNLISKSTENEIWSRHILDSAQIVNFIDFMRPHSLSDLGSGAGFYVNAITEKWSKNYRMEDYIIHELSSIISSKLKATQIIKNELII